METTPFCVYDPNTKRVLRSGVCQLENLQAQAGAGEQVLTARPADGMRQWTVAIVGGVPAFSEVAAVKTLADLKADAIGRLSTRRWEVETGGVECSGHMLATDDRSKLLVSQAAARAERDTSFSARWKFADGWATLSAAQLIAARDAVFAHVDACFAREASIAGEINAAADAAALAAASGKVAKFWP